MQNSLKPVPMTNAIIGAFNSYAVVVLPNIKVIQEDDLNALCEIKDELFLRDSEDYGCLCYLPESTPCNLKFRGGFSILCENGLRVSYYNPDHNSTANISLIVPIIDNSESDVLGKQAADKTGFDYWPYLSLNKQGEMVFNTIHTVDYYSGKRDRFVSNIIIPKQLVIITGEYEWSSK